jgi:endonuclease G
MQAQTYYATNLVPQIQDSFNGGIWNSLEGAIRKETENTDTLYVVTGVAFKTVGGSETVKYIKPQHDTKQCPVPNYFYKVVLKVKRSGSGAVTSARAVGFWFEHKQYSDNYANYAVSVDQIEEWTGFDFFVNLPDSYEGTAEANNSWSIFQNF